ncbi:nucleoside hydrolase [Cystobacter fuscus]
MTTNPDPRPAWEFIRDQLNGSSEPITIISLGGLTNLAQLLEQYPDSNWSNLQQIVIMGGAVFSDGNVSLLNNAMPAWDQGPAYSTNTYAEWNIFIDPLAAQKILRSTLPLTLVPLDACDYVLLDPGYINNITAQDPVAQFAKNLLIKKSAGSTSEPIPVPIFDPLATLVATLDLKHIRRESFCLDVVLEETSVDDHAGQTVIVENDGTLRPITVVTSASQTEFETVYAQIMNGELVSKRQG